VSGQRQLRFRLPGRWFSVDLAGGRSTEESIQRVARDAIGAADDLAQERATVRRELHAAVEAATVDEARSLMFAKEITAGVPLPVTLAVFEPAKLRMSPAIGTDAPAVLHVMAESLKQIDPTAHASMVETAGPGVPALRTHFVEPSDAGEGMLRLVADYWVPVPESKQILMVRFSTPLGELENMMCALFDELIGAAYFSEANAASLREALTRPDAESR